MVMVQSSCYLLTLHHDFPAHTALLQSLLHCLISARSMGWDFPTKKLMLKEIDALKSYTGT